MEQKQIELIIIKFINDEANKDDLITLGLWLKNEKNVSVFNRFIKTEYLIMSSMNEFDLEKAKQSVKKKLKKERKAARLKRFVLSAAAAVVIALISIPYFLKTTTNDINSLNNTIADETIKTGANKAILTLDNGENIVLEEGENYTSNNIKSNGEEIVYSKNTVASEVKVTYNYLTIPRGGQYAIELSDGTKVWVNSDSKIKYPVDFPKGKPRLVELIYGEAYFEVTHSNKNNDSKFMVHSRSQDVEVLGTKFNVKAYLDEEIIYTTLAEGSVNVSTFDSTKTLEPNQQSIINIGSKNIEITKANVYNAVAWKDGIFSFKNMPLKDMMNVLSRWYDTEVVFADPALQNIEYTGVLGKDLKIEDILLIITNLNDITYEIKNNTIVFK